TDSRERASRSDEHPPPTTQSRAGDPWMHRSDGARQRGADRNPVRHRTETATRRRNLGQAFVELALVLPVLLVLFSAALDLGRLYYSQITINNAAKEGALEAAS